MLKRLSNGVVDLVLILIALVAVLPFVFMLVTSLQRSTSIRIDLDPSRFDPSNYVELFTRYGFGMALLTSVIVVVLACAANVFIGALAAYGFAKRPFPGSGVIFWVYLATMMVPIQVTIIPLFLIMRDLDLLNSYVSLVLPFINAFGVFLIRQFMLGVPDELIESARIEGASDLRIFWSVVVPLIRPVLIALTVFTFMGAWNDFLWPLISISSDDMQTVTLALARMQGRFETNYGLVMAGSTISFLVPFVMYVLLQRRFVEGIASTGLKG
jgi:multiple sugar transport system permease protein